MLLLAESGISTPVMIMLGAVVLTTSFLLIRTSRYFSRPKRSDPSWSSIARKAKHSAESGGEFPREMANWQVEMHDFVREIKAELDSKMRALQAVTAEADRAAARLEAALQDNPSAAGPRLHTGSSTTSEEKPVRLPLREALRDNHHGDELGNLPGSQAESLKPSNLPRPARSSAQAKKDEIYMYADYGMKSAEIASRVGHPLGEVELILSLRQK